MKVYVVQTSNLDYDALPFILGVVDSPEKALGIINEEILSHNKGGVEDDPEEFKPMEMVGALAEHEVATRQDYYTFWFTGYELNTRKETIGP